MSVLKCISKVVVALGFCALVPFAQAVTMFSRACPFGDIPVLLQSPFVLLSYAIGSAPVTKFAGLPFLSAEEKYKHFILESFTADYGSAKYFLYAENKAYRYWDATNRYVYETGFKTDGWTINTLPESVLTDPALTPLFVNRGLGVFANARAGHPEIIQLWSPKKVNAYRDFWVVIGKHYYYDGLKKVVNYFGESRAYDCNFTNWGIGLY